MPNVRLYTNQPTAKLLANRASAIWLPFKKQPPSDYKYIGANRLNEPVFHSDVRCGVIPEPPCLEGDTAFLLETWKFNGCISDFYRIEYKDGEKRKFPALIFDSPFAKLDLMDNRWRSPCIMPNIACRHIWRIGKVEAVNLLDDMTDEQIIKVIHPEWNDIRKTYQSVQIRVGFRDWLTTTYPNLSMESWGWLIERLTEEK